jgi:hypothetical protein
VQLPEADRAPGDLHRELAVVAPATASASSLMGTGIGRLRRMVSTLGQFRRSGVHHLRIGQWQ